MSLFSEIDKEEFRTQEFLRSRVSGNSRVYDHVAHEHVQQSQKQLAKIQKHVQKMSTLPWDEQVEVLVRCGGGLFFDALIFKSLGIPAKLGKAKGLQLITEI